MANFQISETKKNPFAPFAPEGLTYDKYMQRQLVRGTLTPAVQKTYEQEFGITKWYKCGQNEAKSYNAVVRAMKKAHDEAHLYTDNSQVVATSKEFSRFFGLKHPEHAFVFGGGGSCAGLDKVMAALLDPVSVVRDKKGKIKVGADMLVELTAKSKPVAFFERVFAVTENAAQTAYATVFHINQPFQIKGNYVTCKHDLAAVEATLLKHKPKVLVVETFGNPSTSKITIAEAKKILEIAKKSGTTILFDMPYSIYGKQDAVVKFIINHINKTNEHGVIFSASKLGLAAKRVGVVYIANKELVGQMMKKMSFAQQEASGLIGFMQALKNATIGKLNKGLQINVDYAKTFINDMSALARDTHFASGKGANFINIYGLDPKKYPSLSHDGLREIFQRRGIIVNDLMLSYRINAIRISPPPCGDMEGFMTQAKLAFGDMEAERSRLISEGATQLIAKKGKIMSKKLFTLAHGSQFAKAAAVTLLVIAGTWLFNRNSTKQDSWSNVG